MEEVPNNTSDWRNAIHRYQQHSMFPPGTAHHAAETGEVAAMEAAVSAGVALGYPASVTLQARDDILQCTPLHIAAERGNNDVVKYLIARRVDLDAGDGFMVTPLHLASVSNHISTVKLLLDAGANLTRQDSQGDQPLHWAATRGHTEVMVLLMERGAQVDAPNSEGWTALHRAACNGSVAASRLLVHRGASIHAMNVQHNTPLHLAAKYNQLSIMNLLLELGTKIDMQNKEGQTAVDLCVGDGARALIQEHAEAAAAAGRPLVSNRRQLSARHDGEAAATAPPAAAVPPPSPPRVRRRPKVNENLDADGFPVSVPTAALVDTAYDQQYEDTQLLFVEPSVAGLQEAAGGMRQTLSSWAGSDATAASTRPSHRQLGTGGSMAGQLQAPTGGIDDVLLADRGRNAVSVLAPAGPKAPGPNQKFLEKYSLSKKGLFAQ